MSKQLDSLENIFDQFEENKQAIDKCSEVLRHLKRNMIVFMSDLIERISNCDSTTIEEDPRIERFELDYYLIGYRRYPYTRQDLEDCLDGPVTAENFIDKYNKAVELNKDSFVWTDFQYLLDNPVEADNLSDFIEMVFGEKH